MPSRRHRTRFLLRVADLIGNIVGCGERGIETGRSRYSGLRRQRTGRPSRRRGRVRRGHLKKRKRRTTESAVKQAYAKKTRIEGPYLRIGVTGSARLPTISIGFAVLAENGPGNLHFALRLQATHCMRTWANVSANIGLCCRRVSTYASKSRRVMPKVESLSEQITAALVSPGL